MSVSNGPILNRTFEMAITYGDGSFRDVVHISPGDPTRQSYAGPQFDIFSRIKSPEYIRDEDATKAPNKYPV